MLPRGFQGRHREKNACISVPGKRGEGHQKEKEKSPAVEPRACKALGCGEL
jgi:hypothetical protein